MFVYVLLCFLTFSIFLVESQNNDVAESKEKFVEKEIHYVSAELVSSKFETQKRNRRRAGDGGYACGKLGDDGGSFCFCEGDSYGDTTSVCCDQVSYINITAGHSHCCFRNTDLTRSKFLLPEVGRNYTRT
jgi:hypothetical protein